MTDQPEPGVAGSGRPVSKTGWWRHPIASAAGIVIAMIAWFTLTWNMIENAEARLEENITAVESNVQADIAAAEARLNTNISNAENRLSIDVARVEDRLDNIMEILLEDARRASIIEESDTLIRTAR